MAEFDVQKTPDQEALEKIIEIKRVSRDQIKQVKNQLKQQKLEQKNKGKDVSLSKAESVIFPLGYNLQNSFNLFTSSS